MSASACQYWADDMPSAPKMSRAGAWGVIRSAIASTSSAVFARSRTRNVAACSSIFARISVEAIERPSRVSIVVEAWTRRTAAGAGALDTVTSSGVPS